ncbi:uncharacterized protein LOC110195501 [Phascolarctos cinereus]|uniref:Uncharacterized protein LOC110195501 n=1 Tax=Phascolarctos cinereus TaxID=38626 RepID=A0A6P5IPE9_PHACI|nr:uncharacterized protein LOC110195501 [Phascolarctos cinereus]
MGHRVREIRSHFRHSREPRAHSAASLDADCTRGLQPDSSRVNLHTQRRPWQSPSRPRRRLGLRGTRGSSPASVRQLPAGRPAPGLWSRPEPEGSGGWVLERSYPSLPPTRAVAVERNPTQNDGPTHGPWTPSRSDSRGRDPNPAGGAARPRGTPRTWDRLRPGPQPQRTDTAGPLLILGLAWVPVPSRQHSCPRGARRAWGAAAGGFWNPRSRSAPGSGSGLEGRPAVVTRRHWRQGRESRICGRVVASGLHLKNGYRWLSQPSKAGINGSD